MIFERREKFWWVFFFFLTIQGFGQLFKEKKLLTKSVRVTVQELWDLPIGQSNTTA